MSKCYIGVSNKARNIKNIYIGVNGKARKVQKAYIGVGGKARIFWAGGTIRKWGTATPLSEPRYDFGAAHVGNYALFAGGISTVGNIESVETYNSSLTKGSAPSFTGQNALGRAVGGQNSTYALFNASNQTTYSYDKSLTIKKRASADASPEGHAVAVSFNNYILFAGGYSSANRRGISIYDASLTFNQTGTISHIMLDAAGTSVGNYVIFGGGRSSRTDGNIYSDVEIYDSSITKLSMSGKNLSVACSSLAATTNKNYAIFSGGFDKNTKAINTVNAYNTAMTKSIGAGLSKAKADHTGISIDTYAMFIGGRTTTYDYTNTVDIYDSTLTKTINTISSNRGYGAGTVIGNKAIFAGGLSRDSGKLAASDIVDVFTT